MKYCKMVKRLLTIVVAVILVICSAACGSKKDTTNVNDNAEYSISLKDSDFIGKWKIVDLPLEELDEDFFGDDTVIIKKDGTYQCGNIKAKLSQFSFIPGSKEKGAYKNTEELGYASYSLQDYGELYCVFTEDNGSQYPISTAIEVIWENEKHTEASLSIGYYGSAVEIKKK